MQATSQSDVLNSITHSSREETGRNPSGVFPESELFLVTGNLNRINNIIDRSWLIS